MKIDRIDRLQGHRIFRDFDWPPALETFSRFNLIYGWNGSGKTTLSNLFRSMASRVKPDEGEVRVSIDGVALDGSDWPTAALPNIRVFNRDTVDRSVFEAPAASELPPIFVVGQKSVEQQREIEEARARVEQLVFNLSRAEEAETEATRRMNVYAAGKAREIKNLLLAPGSVYNNYHAGDFRAAIAQGPGSDSALLDEGEFKKRLAIKASVPMSAIQLKGLPDAKIPDLYEKARVLLSTSVASKALNMADAEDRVLEWLRAGVHLHSDGRSQDRCLFCTQDMPDDRLQQLTSHFDSAYESLAESVEHLVAEVEAHAASLKSLNLPSEEALYSDLRDAYRKEVSAVTSAFFTVSRSLETLATAIGGKKTRLSTALNLHDVLAGGTGETGQDPSFGRLLLAAIMTGGATLSNFMGVTAFQRLAAIVDAHNERSTSFESKIKEARRQLHDNEIESSKPVWIALENEWSQAEIAAKSIRAEEATLRSRIVTLEREIIQHRPAAIEMNRDLAAYLGHEEIQIVPADTGYVLTRSGIAATNLSEGERTAIAFIHFLRSLSDKAFDATTGIVVVDDPISSLDANSTYAAFGFLKQKLSNAAQLFVLTHNFTFFRQVRNWFRFLNRGRGNHVLARFYMLHVSAANGQRSTRIQELDRFLKDYESEYHYLFKKVTLAAEAAEGQELGVYYELPNIARRLLESFLIFRVPDQGSLHARLQAIEYPEPKKTQILRFVDTHSHAEQIDEGQEEAAALPEAPKVLRNLLDLIATTDKGHFDRMRSAMD